MSYRQQHDPGSASHEDPGQSIDAGRPRVPLGLIAGVLLAGLLAVFLFQNTEPVHVELLSFDGEIPLWVVIVVSAAAGAVLARLVPWVVHRLRRRARR